MSRTIVDAPLAKLERLRALQAAASTKEAVRLAKTRASLLEECPHPLALALKLDARTVATPAIELISRTWVQTIREWDGRCTTSLGPQQGKSLLSRWSVFWALLENPDRRVVFASHSMSLARTSGRIIRSLVEQFGAPYGLEMDQAHHDASDWQLKGFLGGCLSASVESTLTGRPSDLMVLDDLLAGEAEANSPTMRDKVEVWWESTARVRMAPGAPAISIGTRWSEYDILARFIAEGWTRINIPAVADGETYDSLEGIPGARTPDGYLISTRGTTPEDFRKIEAEMGPRAHSALMQGRPAPLAGGIFQRDWLDAHRVSALPDNITTTYVAVDPADTGKGDAAGILVGHQSDNGHFYVTADLSGMLSQAQWGRKVCLTAVRVEANAIIEERNLGMSRVLVDAWAVIRRQAAALSQAVGDEDDRVDQAAATLLAAGDMVAADKTELREVLLLIDDILELPSVRPCRVITVTPRASKAARAESITGFYELGVAHHVGKLPQLELEQLTWQPGQKSPNRLDTLGLLLTRLDSSKAQRTRQREGVTPPPRVATPGAATPAPLRGRSTTTVPGIGGGFKRR